MDSVAGAISFRRLTDADLPLLHRWLNEPGVVRFWEGEDVSWDAVVADYGSDSDEPSEYYLALEAGEPFGWIQCYAVSDYADDAEAQAWFALGYPASGAGIDYLIGEPGERGRGRGSAMIRSFVDQVVWPHHPDWTHVAASPFRENAASCRALAKAGLDHFGEFDVGEGPCDLHVQARPTDASTTASAHRS